MKFDVDTSSEIKSTFQVDFVEKSTCVSKCFYLSVLHQTVSREGYLHQTVLSQLKRELPFLPIIAALSANPFVYAATASITDHLIISEQFLTICTFEPSPIGLIVDRLLVIL